MQSSFSRFKYFSPSIFFKSCNCLHVYQELIQLDLACGWAFGVHWSPSGNSLAYVGEYGVVLMIPYSFSLVNLSNKETSWQDGASLLY